MIKNAVFRSGSHALGLPTGTSSVAPDYAVNGQTRFNSSNGANGKVEFYGNVTGTPSWNSVAREGNVLIVADKTFVGTGSQTDFGPMSYSYAAGKEAQVIVHVGTVYQIPGTNYTFMGNAQIHFASAPTNGSAITIIHNFASTSATL